MNKPTLAIYASKDVDTQDFVAFTHSHNLCIMQDGKIVKYLELERLSRKKYDNRLDLFLEDLLEHEAKTLTNDFDFVLVNDFLGSSFISRNGKIRFESEIQENLIPDLVRGILTIRTKDFEVKKISAWCCSHEKAHLFSTVPFYGELKDNSLLFSFDGASSFGNYSSFTYKDNKLELIENNWTDLKEESKFFNDNPLVFKMLGLERKDHCSVPGKLMGFASWGTYDSKIEKWLVSNNYFKDFWGKEQEILESVRKNFGINTEFSTHNSFMQDCAATFQKMFEHAVLDKLESLQKKYHCDYLYYGGGCALNIVTNTKIIESGMFKEVFIAPCCNDSGLSVGAAAFLERKKGNEIKIHQPYLNNIGLDCGKIPLPSNELIKNVADIIMNNGIVGVCNGYGEIGPRALGNRSLIALPNDKLLSQKLSTKVKKREWYRPVAPIMLKSIAEKVAIQRVAAPSKYMLMDFEIRHEFDNDLCGVIHANQTARIQTIDTVDDNPFMYHLLTCLYEKYKVLALINTSFNAQGEPIVHTKEDALSSAKTMNLEALIYNNQLIKNEDF
ncbi:MAG: hypothetical protein MJZ76_09215 [Bacteroidales bacterium]|nr:hypothetical protein [Bacteroidales bacterium]